LNGARTKQADVVKFLVFQHLEIEHPGVFREFWREDGVEWFTVNFDHGDPIPVDLAVYDALVVMGGPMDVWEIDQHPWLTGELAAIHHFVVDLGRPYLGVCLGHQLLAAALGGEVGPAQASEVGSTTVHLTGAARADALFRGLASPLTVFEWHSAEVLRLPRDAVALARTELCAVQAFRWGQHAYGIQFHPEIDEQSPSEWRTIPAYEKSLEAAFGPGGSARLERATRQLLPIYRKIAKHLNRNFSAIVETNLALAQ
jgi:GMP synthase-like glutamine amidotransferase